MARPPGEGPRESPTRPQGVPPMTRNTIRLAPFDVAADLPLLAAWLTRAHVSRWWPDGDRQLAEARERPRGSGQALILVDEAPVGYMRWQRVDKPLLDELGLAD